MLARGLDARVYRATRVANDRGAVRARPATRLRRPVLTVRRVDDSDRTTRLS